MAEVSAGFGNVGAGIVVPEGVNPPPCIPRMVMVKAPHWRSACPGIITGVREDDAVDVTCFPTDPTEKPAQRHVDIPHESRASGGWYWHWPAR